MRDPQASTQILPLEVRAGLAGQCVNAMSLMLTVDALSTTMTSQGTVVVDSCAAR